MEHLLDVNVLVALLWTGHTKHPAAKRWFGRILEERDRWATCAMTQAGFIRVLSNPVVNEGRLTLSRTTDILERNLGEPEHRMWNMDLSWPEAKRLAAVEELGWQQVTDVYLIGLAVKHKGRLVTFDRALGKLNKVVTVIGGN